MFKEIGPFVYKETRIKEDLVNNMNGTLTYKERRLFYFVPEMSPYNESYPIVTLNIAAMSTIFFIKNTPWYDHTIVNEALKVVGETLIMTKTAGQLLFGYNDTFLEVVIKFDKNLVPSATISLFYNVNTISLLIFLRLSRILRFFCLIIKKKKNNTYEGEFTMYTGADDYSKIGQFERFNRME
jgi:hypothetical protein